MPFRQFGFSYGDPIKPFSAWFANAGIDGFVSRGNLAQPTCEQSCYSPNYAKKTMSYMRRCYHDDDDARDNPGYIVMKARTAVSQFGMCFRLPNIG